MNIGQRHGLIPVVLATLLLSASRAGVLAQSAAKSENGSACVSAPRMMIVTRVDPPAIRTDFGLEEIAARAKRAEQTPPHRPLGFYLGRIVYKIDWRPYSADGCAERFQAVAALALTDRRIEIGRELESNPCLYGEAVAHYARHAAADETAFQKFATEIENLVRASLLEPPGADAAQRSRIEEAIRSVIDAELKPLNRARSRIQDTVDTKEEIEKLKGSCAGNGQGRRIE